VKKLPVIPPMKCDAGCGKCCGPAPCSTQEFKALQKHIAAKGIVPIEQGITCPVYINGTCAVYEVRPLICRAFGHVEKLKCAHGYDVPARGLDRKLRKIHPTHTTLDLLA
jgi:Fe-S-cluster containining protein